MPSKAEATTMQTLLQPLLFNLPLTEERSRVEGRGQVLTYEHDIYLSGVGKALEIWH